MIEVFFFFFKLPQASKKDTCAKQIQKKTFFGTKKVLSKKSWNNFCLSAYLSKSVLLNRCYINWGFMYFRFLL